MARAPINKKFWLIALILILVGLAIWAKVILSQQPETHEDPGIPDLVVPDPEDVE